MTARRKGEPTEKERKKERGRERDRDRDRERQVDLAVSFVLVLWHGQDARNIVVERALLLFGEIADNLGTLGVPICSETRSSQRRIRKRRSKERRRRKGATSTSHANHK
jgi:hypothetical protein